MSLIVTLLVVMLVTQCWSAPQRINWTPQAILYLKGAQGHRSVLERTSREEVDSLLSASHGQSRNEPGLSLDSSTLLKLLLQAVEDGENPDNYSEEQEIDLNYI